MINRSILQLIELNFLGGKKISNLSENAGTLSLICGLVSIFFSLSFLLGIGSVFLTSFAIPFAFIGIVLARARLKKGPDSVARAGLITSVFGFLLNLASFALFLLLFR